MRFTTRSICVAVAIGTLGGVQAARSETVPVSQLRTPSAPGFVLLGVEPESVDRPLDPRDVSISLVTAAAHGNNLIPQNYAIEVAPYWLKERRYLTFSDMFRAGTLETIKQTFSLSIAFASGLSGLDSTETGLGGGIRVAICRGTLSKTDGNARDSLRVINDQIADAYERGDSAALDALSTKASEWSRELGNSRRVGFNLDMALALTSIYPSTGFGGGKFGKFGAWVTPAWVGATFEYVGVVRYIHDERNKHDDVCDLGLRLVARHRGFAISLEGLSRQSVNTSKDDGRLAAIVEYQVGESNYFIATFGQDFDSIEGAQRLLATAGFTFGFGEKPAIDLSK